MGSKIIRAAELGLRLRASADIGASASPKRKSKNTTSHSAHNWNLEFTSAIMALYQRAPYETASRQDTVDDESDREEEALVEDYKEQVHFDDGMSDLDRTTSFGGAGGGGGPQDMQAQLAAAATPLEYGAALDTKFASYDNYCNLFHYILNSEGPVDLEVPTVSVDPSAPQCALLLMGMLSTTGHGT